MRPERCIRGHPLDPAHPEADVQVAWVAPHGNRRGGWRHVCRVCKRIRQNTYPRKRRPYKKVENPKNHRAEEIWEEYHALGLSYAELAQRLGVQRDAIYQALRRHARANNLPIPADRKVA